MKTITARQLSSTRTILGLIVAWGLTGIAWMIAVAFSLAGPALGFLVAMFAAVSVGTLILLSFWGRTREVWDVLRLDNAALAYVMWTVLGAVVFSMLTFVAWSLFSIWYLQTRYSPGAPIRIQYFWGFTLPIPVLWIFGRALVLSRRLKLLRGSDAKTR